MPKMMNELQNISKKMFREKDLVTSAFISSRTIELNHKINCYIGTLEDYYNYLIEFKSGNFEYEEIDFKKVRKEVKESHIHNVERFSEITIKLYLEKHNLEEIQLDFIGQAYYTLTFIMLELIYENDYDFFEKLYPNFFILCEVSNSYIKEIISNTLNLEYVAKKYTMTTINFMNISGFAMYYSHLTSDNRWERLVLNHTDELLSNAQKKEEWITLCKNCAEVVKEKYFCSSLIEINIKSSIQNFISGNNMLKFKNTEDFYGKVIDSEDKLIQKFGYRETGFPNEFYEIYLYFCINNYCDDEKKYKTKYNWAEKEGSKCV